MAKVRIACAEFAQWAQEEAKRIQRGEAQPYHAVLTDPPYGLEFMGQEWDSFATDRTEAARPSTNPNLRGRKVNPISRVHLLKTSKPLAPEKYQAWTAEWGRALIPLLLPGALMLCFGGTRTWHRLTCGLEDAGFEIWDTLIWLHGQGFPKTQAIDMLIDKQLGAKRPIVGSRILTGNAATPTKEKGGTYGTGAPCAGPTKVPVTDSATETSRSWRGHKTSALKPAWEPILCLKAPAQGKTYAELALEHGSGALNVDGGRIAGIVPKTIQGASSRIYGGGKGFYPHRYQESSPSQLGRYPANLCLECICERVEIVDAPDYMINCYNFRGGVKPFGGGAGHPYTSRTCKGGKAIRHTNPECPCYQLDAQAGEARSSGIFTPHGDGSYSPSPTFGGRNVPATMYGDKGGPSRFFYCAKASRSEREAGLEEIADTKPVEIWGGGIASTTKLGPGHTEKGRAARAAHAVRNMHPTVKPIALTRWLASLLLPPDSVKPRRLLVPFSGSGSEIIGAMQAGWDEIVGVEMDAHYCKIACARCAHWRKTLAGHSKQK